jgi:hypothetical protein
MVDRRVDHMPDSQSYGQESIVPARVRSGPSHGVASRPLGHSMITSLKIQNFRPFRRTELSGLSRVNIVVGDNGSGKTAFLESLFLAAAANPQLPITLRQWRGLETMPNATTIDIYDALWNNLFNNFDKDQTIRIELRGSKNDSRSLSMHFQQQAAITVPLNQNGGGGSELKPSTGIYQPFVFHWTALNMPDAILTMRISASGLQAEGNAHESNLRAAFIPAHAQTSNQFTATLFSNLSKQNKESEFVAALRMQFPAIDKVSVEIEAGASAIFVSVPSLAQKIPLALFSNAASNLASMLLNIASNVGGIVCLDEIENGFHYTRYETVWRQAYEFAGVFETQIFASTHSLECLKAALSIMEKHPDDFSLVQVFQENGVSDARVIAGREAANAIEHDMEVRG